MRIVIMVMALLLVAGCGTNKAVIGGQASGPKELFVNMASDPLLISIELKAALQEKGYDVALNTEAVRTSQEVQQGNRTVVTQNVSQSQNRYELTVGYQPIQNRIQMIAASLRDRQTSELLGTYRWTWARLAPAPTIERAIGMIDQNLLAPVFREQL